MNDNCKDSFSNSENNKSKELPIPPDELTRKPIKAPSKDQKNKPIKDPRKEKEEKEEKD